MWLFCMVYARNSNERIIPMDISVYNGEGSILLNWTIPDSIKAKNTIIYSQKFGNEELIVSEFFTIIPFSINKPRHKKDIAIL